MLWGVIAMLISLSVTLSGTAPSQAASGSEPTPVPQLVTLDAFSRDRTLFDSDMANGNDSAEIPLSGTAPPEAAIQARIVTESGTAVEGWTQIAVANGAGAWSGTVRTGRNAEWLRPQVRLAANPGVKAVGAHRFGVGMIVFYSRQSNGERLWNLAGYANDAPTPPGPVLDPDAFQMITIENRGAPNDPDVGTVSNFIRISESNPRSAPVQEMASILTRNAPGLKVLFVVDVKPGAAMYDTLQKENLAGDPKVNRKWSKVQDMVDRVTADGAQLGAFMFNHTAGLNQSQDTLAENMGRILLSMEPDGTPFRDPVIGEGTLDGRPQDGVQDPTVHTWPDMFPGLLTGRTRILCGPHHYNNGWVNSGYASDDAGIFKYTPSYLKFIADWSDPDKYDMGSVPPPIDLWYAPNVWGTVNGTNDGYDDGSHYTSAHDLGVMEAARGTMALLLNGVGVLNFGYPKIDDVEWDENYVRIKSTSGPWTTYAHENGMNLSAELAALGLSNQQALGISRGPKDFPYATKIIDPTETDPVAAPHVGKGDIVVLPPTGETFDSTTVMDAFQQIGLINNMTPQDHRDVGQYLRPVIDVGVEGWAGATSYMTPATRNPIMVNYATGENRNTLPAPPGSAYIHQQGSWNVESNGIPAGTSQMTFETEMRYLPGNTNEVLFYQNLGDWPRRQDITWRTDGTLETGVTQEGEWHPIWQRSIATGQDTSVMHKLRVVIDMDRGNVRVFVNDVEVTNAFHGDVQGLGTQGGNHTMTLTANPMFISVAKPKEVEYVRIWFTAEADGSTPTAQPDYEIVGTANDTYDTNGGALPLNGP